MKFLLGENFPRPAADLIEECGHEAVRFDAVCNSGDDDDTVFVAAQRVCATILTSDRDFYHTIPLLHPVYAGIPSRLRFIGAFAIICGVETIGD